MTLENTPLWVILLLGSLPALATIAAAIIQSRKTDRKVEKVKESADKAAEHIGVSNGHGTVVDMLTTILVRQERQDQRIENIERHCPYAQPVPLPRRKS